MIIDTSAIVAIVRGEAESAVLARWIQGAESRRMSAATYAETAAVIDGQRNPQLSAALDHLLRQLRVEIVPFTPGQAALARDAYQRFGKGSGHPAQLNLGDCFAYALARDLGEPLLYKGRDFALTDIEQRTVPIRRDRLSEALAPYLAD